jgi:hypothetical protein
LLFLSLLNIPTVEVPGVPFTASILPDFLSNLLSSFNTITLDCSTAIFVLFVIVVFLSIYVIVPPTLGGVTFGEEFGERMNW